MLTKILAVVLLATITMVSTSMAYRLQVNVSNQLSRGRKITVRCESKDDDLGSRRLVNGDVYSWSFSRNIFGTTLFWCDVATARSKKHLSFNAYDESQRKKGMPKLHELTWEIKDDGLYFAGFPIPIAPWVSQ
ncbi:unnamed protein product [Linum tenue]|uniref:S-protein homolog n=2 Tax=Linum tenue TaxID=586396 RepID=A0AAV0RVW9_9ROSI|nr:unnamed protein product [Linum tenue]